MQFFQFIIVGFTLFAISRTILGFKKGRINTTKLIIWSILWIAAGSATLLPHSTTIIARTIGVSRGTDLIVYLSITVIFYIVFKIYLRLEKIESNITTIIKEITLRDKK